ncbi:MAG: 30S ribosomal protein S2, partial [Candidatus Nanopelagicales bacterium]
AVTEARKLNIPVVGILDSNCDPEHVDFAIPGNDDAIRSIQVLTKIIGDAVAEGLIARSQRKSPEAAEPAAEPLAEWEQELLAGAATETTEDNK